MPFSAPTWHPQTVLALLYSHCITHTSMITLCSLSQLFTSPRSHCEQASWRLNAYPYSSLYPQHLAAPGSTWQLENVQEMYADGRKMLRQEGKNERRRVKGQEPFFMYLCTCPKMCIHRLLAYSRLSLLVTHTTYQIYIECLLCTRWREDISTWLMHVVSDLSITTQGI